MPLRQPDQAVALPCFRAYAGSGLGSHCVARWIATAEALQRLPNRFAGDLGRSQAVGAAALSRHLPCPQTAGLAKAARTVGRQRPQRVGLWGPTRRRAQALGPGGALAQRRQARRVDGVQGIERRLASYLKPQLLVLDDFGLKPLPPSGPVDLYDVVDGRYERGSLVVTSNRAPSEWPELFGDPLLAGAALDRLIHRAAVVLISGRSYRLASQGASREGKEETTTTIS
jgi:hypothetical protein